MSGRQGQQVAECPEEPRPQWWARIPHSGLSCSLQHCRLTSRGVSFLKTLTPTSPTPCVPLTIPTEQGLCADVVPRTEPQDRSVDGVG